MDWGDHRAMRVEKFRAGLHSAYLPIYDYLAKSLSEYWAPISGLRTIQEQSDLFNQGRTPESKARGEKIVTRALPGQSLHNYGLASDWILFDVNGQPIWTNKNWAEYSRAVRKAGGEWAGNWITFKEYVHNQFPTKVRGTEIYQEYKSSGFEAAMDMIIKTRSVKNG